MGSSGSGQERRAVESVLHPRALSRGFTLAELLIAIAVGALLFAVGIPSLTAFVRNSAQVSATNELVATLHFARDLAVTRNTRVTVCPSANGATCQGVDWNEGWIVFEDPDSDRVVDADETIERTGDDVGALAFTTGEFGGFLIFRPNGRVMGNDIRDNMGEFTVCDDRGDQHARVVIIDISGRPRVSDVMADGSAPSCA
jgi:type IV fimbrial biogenesis protein FimT